jgi:hypothetical protein
MATDNVAITVALGLDPGEVEAMLVNPEPRDLVGLGVGLRVMGRVADLVREHYSAGAPQHSAAEDLEATTVRYELERELRHANAAAATLRGVLYIMSTIDKLAANVERLERLATTALDRAKAADEDDRRKSVEVEAQVDALADRVWAAGDKLEAALGIDTPTVDPTPAPAPVEPSTPSSPETPHPA